MRSILEQGEYVEASPCESADLPQTRLEPILLRYATQNGFRLRFDTEFLGFREDEKTGKIESVVEDLVTGTKLSIRSKYLCGADGANSSIVRELQLPLHDEPFQGLALNVLIEADMVNHAHLLKFNNTLISGSADASNDSLYRTTSYPDPARQTATKLWTDRNRTFCQTLD